MLLIALRDAFVALLCGEFDSGVVLLLIDLDCGYHLFLRLIIVYAGNASAQSDDQFIQSCTYLCCIDISSS